MYICYLEQGYNYQSSCIFSQAFLNFPHNNTIFVSRYNITEDIALMVPPVSINIFVTVCFLHIKIQNIH